jgi:CheY-like chemotaxis protein
MREGKGLILLVEDEEDICWALSRILSKIGYVTRAALSGKEALQLAERIPFELGFVDAKLPDIDGIELAARLRETRAGLPLILISGYFYNDDIAVRDSVSGDLFCTFVSKPFRTSEITEAVRLALQSS